MTGGRRGGWFAKIESRSDALKTVNAIGPDHASTPAAIDRGDNPSAGREHRPSPCHRERRKNSSPIVVFICQISFRAS